MKHDALSVAIRAARTAGRIHLSRLRDFSIERKSNSLDLVTEADREAEAAAVGILKRAFPDHAVLAEESGSCGGSGDYRWIVDPLDGTTNFAHGYPRFCVSIALERRGRLQAGVVFDAFNRECFAAERGKGATVNGNTIGVTRTPALVLALLGTGFPYDRRQRASFYLAFMEAFMMRARGIRRSGSAALDLCYVACGRLDAFWEFGLKSWDIAAGSLIIEEAGGKVTNLDGSKLNLDGARILASNRRLHREMLGVLADAFPEAERRQAETRARLMAGSRTDMACSRSSAGK